MVCIYCKNNTRVVNSRPNKLNNQIWRRRKCQSCAAIVTSIEKIDLASSLMVLKTNGSYQPFVISKIYISIFLSINHKSDAALTSDYLTSNVLRHLFKQKLGPSVSSAQISKSVVFVLKKFDAASAVKYLSFKNSMALPSDVNKYLRK